MALRRLNLGLVLPESGPSGIFGPSCYSNAELAIEEINERGGILGREVTATTFDGGSTPQVVASQVRRALAHEDVDAVVGWHTSAVRREIVRAVAGQIPYIYTAVYEGGERTDGVFMTGEVPGGQVLPALRWMAREHGIRSWYVVGSDYVWPRLSAAAVRNQISERSKDSLLRDVTVSNAEFIPLGTSDFSNVLDAIERSDSHGVLLFLLGHDAVEFNREFARRGFHRDYVRLSPLMDENMLLASGTDATNRLYSVSGFFESLATGHSMDFESRYVAKFGLTAPPLTSPGESCYEGILLLEQLSQTAGTLDVRAMAGVAGLSSLDYDSPRGHVRLEESHLRQDVYLALADGLEFDIVARVSAV